MNFWQPTATNDALKFRAYVLSNIRNFFHNRGVLEVDVPLLGKTGVTDPFIDCFELNVNGETRYLQSSPEYFMKRLLASGSGPIYFLGKAFRAEEVSSKHQPEFTILEWYRLDFDNNQLMKEIADLMNMLKISNSYQSIRYADLFKKYIRINPHEARLEDLQKIASTVSDASFFEEDRSVCLDLIFSMCIEPQLPKGLVFIYDYPACQSALAKQKKDHEGNYVAQRFELYLDNLELANGYVELIDLDEHIARFAKDQFIRERLGKKIIPLDHNLLESLNYGLPACAGVAIGIDRLIMKLMDLNDISKVMSFGYTGVDSNND